MKTAAILTGVAMLAACSNGGAPAAGAPSSAMVPARAVPPDHARSWMAPDAKKQNLLYVSDTSSENVYVYTFPKGQLKGTLTGINTPEGLCANTNGDVFVTNLNGSAAITEYSHGGTTPIATLSDAGGAQPSACAVDPTTGNLAVTNSDGPSTGYPGVVIYADAKGTPTPYSSVGNIIYPSFCGYDNAGNLFISGTEADRETSALSELPAGSSTFINITVNYPVGPGAVQWDGKYIAVSTHGNFIYRLRMNGSKATIVSAVILSGTSSLAQFWINKKRLVGANRFGASVGIWAYPAGGTASKTITTDLSEPFGAAVSLAPASS